MIWTRAERLKIPSVRRPAARAGPPEPEPQGLRTTSRTFTSTEETLKENRASDTQLTVLRQVRHRLLQHGGEGRPAALQPDAANTHVNM